MAVGTALRILLVDDSEEDAHRLLSLLEAAGYNAFYERVSGFAAMKSALAAREWDLVISDYTLRQFSAVTALGLVREAGLDLPFIVVSGTAGEATAVEAMRAGAHDFLTKSALARLVPAIERELREASIRAERRETQHSLRESEERFRLLVEGVRDFAIFMLDPAGDVVSWNSSAELIMGYSSDEIRGQSFSRFHPPEDAAAGGELERTLEAARRDGRFERQGWCVRRDGSRFWAHEVLSALFDEEGAARGFSTVVRDVTDRKQADEFRRASETKFRRVFESNMIGIFFWSLSGPITIANEAFLRMIGYSREDLFDGKIDWRALTPSDSEPLDQAAIQTLRATSVVTPYEKVFIHKDGRRVPVLIGAAILDGAVENGVGFVIDLTERKRAEEALGSAFEERARLAASEQAAVQASRLKSEFVANISHELRTPMNSLIGIAGILLDSPLGKREREYVETMKSSAERLLTMINDILDLSRMEAGKLSPESRDFEVRALGTYVEGLLGPLAEAKGIRLVTEVDADVPARLHGDSTRVGQILLNVCGNAVKFTDSGEVRLHVSVASREGGSTRLCFEVADTGIGISPAQRGRIFRPFSQGDGSMARRYGGTGLGLSISKQLVELLDGEIELVSMPAKGSTFWVRIPFAPANEALERRVDVKSPAARGSAARPQPGARILVVEDNPVNREVALQMLRKLDCRPEFAEEAESALALLEKKKFDLVLMDCQLPGVDGFQATHRIRERERAGRKRLPIVAMTANAMQGDRERCLQSGMDDYVAKPIELEVLGQVLARWVPASPARLDRSSLEKLRALRSPGRPDFLKDMASVFFAATPGRLDKMRAAVSEKDLRSVAREAHIVKSSSASLGAGRMAELSRKLEELGEAPRSERASLGSARSLLKSLEREFASVKLALEKELDSGEKTG
jgi:PAS domain S-box-containing protein